MKVVRVVVLALVSCVLACSGSPSERNGDASGAGNASASGAATGSTEGFCQAIEDTEQRLKEAAVEAADSTVQRDASFRARLRDATPAQTKEVVQPFLLEVSKTMAALEKTAPNSDAKEPVTSRKQIVDRHLAAYEKVAWDRSKLPGELLNIDGILTLSTLNLDDLSGDLPGVRPTISAWHRKNCK